ncbi:hypothetical protein YC2023_081517 [Brassica napus]
MSMLLKIWRRHKFEPYTGYIAEHPNDEEEVEGIDLHQQRYPWEGSDMDYLYDEQSSFAHLLSMELTLEIDGVIFHVPMLTQAPILILSFNMPKSQCRGCCKFVAFDSEITKLAMCQDNKSITADGKWGCYAGCLVFWAWLYKAQAGNICVAAFDSTCSGICRTADPIVEVNMQCIDLEIIIWKLHFEAFPQHINRP